MKEYSRTITTSIVTSDDGSHRYLFSRSWGEETKPMITIITLNSGKADGIWEDQTIHIITNCVYDLKVYQGFHAVNLFSGINTKAAKDTPLNTLYNSDTDTYIVQAAEDSEKIVLAMGTGMMSNPVAEFRYRRVLELLQPHRKKLFLLANATGRTGFHPLRVRKDWKLVPFEKPVEKKKAKKIPENKIKTTIEINANKSC